MIYTPLGQGFADTTETLARAGLIKCRRDEHGEHVVICDKLNLRVLCWQLGVNSQSRCLGRGDVFTDLPVDVLDRAPPEILH